MLVCSAWAVHVTAMTHHTIYVTAGGCTTPITVVEPDLDQPIASVIMLHGLAANRRVMNYLADQLAFDGGFRVYVLDLAGHGDNTSPFSFYSAENCAGAVVAQLISSRAIDPKNTAYVGHSLGAIIAIRLADREPLAGTVAISPGPVVLPKRMPSNLLVLTGSLDIPRLKSAALSLSTAAGGDRVSVDDFLQQRAFLLDAVPRASHTSLLANQQVEDDTRDWVVNSTEAAIGDADGVVDWKTRAGFTAEQPQPSLRAALGRVWYAALRLAPFWGLAGLLLVCPLLLAIASKFSSAESESADSPRSSQSPASSAAKTPSPFLALLEWAVCSLLAVLILIFFSPMHFLRLFSAGYLASFLLLVGLFIALLNSSSWLANFRWTAPLTLSTIVVSLLIFLSIGAWANWQLFDLWMNPPRWLRFFGFLPAAWLYFYAEEIVLGPVRSGWRRASRFLLFLLLRLIVLGACAVGVFWLSSGAILILLLAGFLAIASVLIRLGSDSLRHRSGSATAAALFGAILASWIAAAVFPLT